MLVRFLVVLMLIDVSFGQNEYPNYPEEPPANTPEAYPNPDYGTNPEPNPAPQYPDYSQVETVETTTAATTTQNPTTNPPKRRQVFPPTPTSTQSRRQSNRIVRWLFLDDQGYPIRTAVRRRYRTGSQINWIPPYYRSMVSGSRSTRPNAALRGSRKINYWWYT